MLQELIHMVKDIRDAKRRGEEEGVSAVEVAFYSALADNESAVEVMGNDQLKAIAHELLTCPKSGVAKHSSVKFNFTGPYAVGGSLVPPPHSSKQLKARKREGQTPTRSLGDPIRQLGVADRRHVARIVRGCGRYGAIGRGAPF